MYNSTWWRICARGLAAICIAGRDCHVCTGYIYCWAWLSCVHWVYLLLGVTVMRALGIFIAGRDCHVCAGYIYCWAWLSCVHWEYLLLGVTVMRALGLLRMLCASWNYAEVKINFNSWSSTIFNVSYVKC